MPTGAAAPPVDRALADLADALDHQQPPCSTSPDDWFDTDAGVAIAVCRTCPGSGPCLTYGLAVGAEAGVFGGVGFPRRMVEVPTAGQPPEAVTG